MALDRNNAMLDVTGAWIHQIVKEQSWFKENANTITTVVGFLGSVVAAVAATPWAANPYVYVAILVAGWVLTIFGVKNTHNGFSKSQIVKMEQAQSLGVSALPFHDADTDLAAETATYSDTAVDEYLARNK